MMSCDRITTSASLPATSEPVCVLGVRGVGGVERERRERLLARQALIRRPAFGRLAVDALTRDRRVEAEHRIRFLDGEVRSARDARARVDQLAPHIRAFRRALGADARGHPRHVGRAVRRLDRGDHVERLEARDLRGVEDLRVLVAHPQRLRGRHFLLHALEHVHRHPVAAIADRVDAGLKAGLRRRERLRVDLVGRRGEEAGRAGLVAVRFEQRRAARAERAVRADLDRAHREPMIRVVR